MVVNIKKYFLSKEIKYKLYDIKILLLDGVFVCLFRLSEWFLIGNVILSD